MPFGTFPAILSFHSATWLVQSSTATDMTSASTLNAARCFTTYNVVRLRLRTRELPNDFINLLSSFSVLFTCAFLRQFA
jgi:hypothetical protein